MTTSRIVRISKKGQLVLPKELREAVGIRENSDVVIAVEEGRLTLAPPHEYARSTRGLLKGTWGKTRREVERNLNKERQSWD
jgi:AbrB family looped-hinge helix DNA binding protein